MKSVSIRVSDKAHELFTSRAKERNLSLAQYITSLLIEDIERESGDMTNQEVDSIMNLNE